ncbi:alpha/beta hydrolase [[Mycobacterium] burgundiense]|uniref:Alpha/beta hydrolase n=1 Tax=[Mycobacterium] burgundiense TaxID=3064286 RepID=A0ABN9NP58_9MYCO|nr:alpha/beta hydrolase [Mycolicibacterium sp. MU0053]CAJ1509932.1 alpha/beta hydrolase [Mycolicibacterium sp. MU0053]
MTAGSQSRAPEPTLWSRAESLLRTSPADCLLAASSAAAQLPVIGKHLEQLGGYTAISMWAGRHAPEILSSATKSWFTPGIGKIRQADRDRTHAASEAALRGIVGDADLDIAWPAPDRTPPLLRAHEHRRHLHRSAVRYGEEPTQLLDVWRRRDMPTEPAPVLIFLPGGAWVHGGRALQGYALMSHLAELGWVCLSVEYRVAPGHRWPQHIRDVKTAIAWARANVDRFGGDRDFVAVAGCSAGGHLAALAGLTAGDPDYQAHLPAGSDTAVDAVIGVYGRYCWEDRSTVERQRFVDFLERVVVNQRLDRDPEVFRNASPIARVHAEAPPFLVLHGSGDTIIPVEQARDFVTRLRNVSRAPVGYLELPGAGHGFDLTDGARTGAAATAIGLFLNQIHRTRAAMQTKQAI